MIGLEILRRDMDELRDDVRADWPDLGKTRLTSIERRNFKVPILTLIAELKLLLGQLNA